MLYIGTGAAIGAIIGAIIMAVIGLITLSGGREKPYGNGGDFIRACGGGGLIGGIVGGLIGAIFS